MERKFLDPESDVSARRPPNLGAGARDKPRVVPCPHGVNDLGTIDFPDFRPRAPWWGGDLQTVRNFVTRQPADLPGLEEERLFFETGDGTGDRLQAVLNRPAKPVHRPLLVLVHGLTGCEDSTYLCASARHFLDIGWPTLRVNMRGAGPSRGTCKYHYHAGRSEDLRAVLTHLPGELIGNGVVLMGFSLGGNQMLKLLGEGGAALAPVRAAVSVSAPVDLSASSNYFSRRRNGLYHRWLLGRMKEDATAPGAALNADEQRAIASARTVYQFDDRFVAPRHGFANAEDYYSRCSALRFLAKIDIPTLILHARDDPWIPFDALAGHDWRSTPMVRAVLPRSGGHVGFHGRGTRTTWHDRCAEYFFESIVRAC
jgi:predicted alpha/beta-fold hydrolase